MAEIINDLASFTAAPVLPWRQMSKEDEVRKRIQRLVSHGFDQKMIAAKMGVSESWLSRWLRKTGRTRAITVPAMEGFDQYMRELRDLTSETPSGEATGASDPTGSRRRRSG